MDNFIFKRYKRYKRIKNIVNKTFRNSDECYSHAFFVGSYGRGTAVKESDIDILMELPNALFYQFALRHGNSQSQLLGTLRNAILETFPGSDVRADGQVVKINFCDGMKFELLPAFKNPDGSYCYPDSNKGGKWCITDPKIEKLAMRYANRESGGLLFYICKLIRNVHNHKFKSYKLSGFVVDSFVYSCIETWLSESANSFDDILWEKAFELANGGTLRAPGSEELVDFNDSLDCLIKILRDISIQI